MIELTASVCPGGPALRALDTVLAQHQPFTTGCILCICIFLMISLFIVVHDITSGNLYYMAIVNYCYTVLKLTKHQNISCSLVRGGGYNTVSSLKVCECIIIGGN